jgi:hypothetical protein
MDARQKLGARSLRRARGFLNEHPDIAAPVNGSDTRKTLDDAVTRLEAENVTQDEKRKQLNGETAQIHALREDLRLNHMRPIANVAKAKFASEPFFVALKLPGMQIDNEALVNATREMSGNAAAQSATFIAAGLPADFAGLYQMWQNAIRVGPSSTDGGPAAPTTPTTPTTPTRPATPTLRRGCARSPYRRRVQPRRLA